MNKNAKAYDQRPRILNFLGYTWRLIINIFYVAVVILILAKIHEKDSNLTVIVGALGLVYTAIRAIGIGQFNTIIPLLFAVT
jgi:hypothetical protein